MAHPSRNDRKGFTPNPDGMPTFLDYFFVDKGDGVLSVEKGGIMRENEEYCRTKIEEIKGFTRWCTQDDVDQINDHWRQFMIKQLADKKNNKRVDIEC